MLPGILLIRKDADIKVKAVSLPIVGAMIAALTHAPMIPVPNGSAAAERSFFCLAEVLRRVL